MGLFKKKKKVKREPKIIRYMNSLSPEEIVEREKEFRKKAYFREGGGSLLVIICILGIIILSNIF